MKKFEYMSIHLESDDKIEEMNKLGQEGWELCGSHKGVRLIFKREIE